MCLVNDSFKRFYEALKDFVSEKKTKQIQKSLENLQKSIAALWKLISEKIEPVILFEPAKDYEIYIDTCIIENSKCRINKILIWEDFKTKNPESTISKSDFYIFLADQGFSAISHSGKDFYLVEITIPKSQSKYQNYFRRRLIKNDDTKMHRYTIWDDFKKKYPNDDIKMKDFYMLVEKQKFKKTRWSNSIYFGVDFC